MLPLHGALKVRHTHTQRSPQKQELSLLGQRKTSALANKLTNLLGAIAQLGLDVALVANRNTNDGKAVLVMLHPKRCCQRSNRSLPGLETGAPIHTALVRSHFEAYRPETVWAVPAEMVPSPPDRSRLPHHRDVVKVRHRWGAWRDGNNRLQDPLQGKPEQQRARRVSLADASLRPDGPGAGRRPHNVERRASVR